MGSRREMVKVQARTRGNVAALSGVATVGAVAFFATVNAPVMAIGAGVAGVLITGKKTWDWLKYRGEWGLKF